MKKFFFRISLIVVIMAVFVYYIARNLGTIEHTVNVTLSQSLGYVFLAAIFCALAYFFMALMNKEIFGMMGIRRKTSEMLLLKMSSLAVNVVVPSAGVSVGIMFASDARKRSESEAAAVTAVILALLTDYASIAFLLIIAMLYLLSIGSLGLPVIIPAIAFLGLTLGLFLLIFLAGKNKSALKGFLDKAKGLLNKLLALVKRKGIGDETVVDQFIAELENAYVAIKSDRKSIYKALGFISASQLMYLMALYVLFVSLGIAPLYRVLLSGYAIGVMFVVISPTPNGVGFVEGSMALAYASLGVPGAVAATVVLIYRGFSFWLPLLVGFVALQRRHLLELFEQAHK